MLEIIQSKSFEKWWAMKLGVCYYPEQWPHERWPEDARLMREAGLSLVRIAEFAWVAMEPNEGKFNWDWLDRAIDVLSARKSSSRSQYANRISTSLALPCLSRNSSGGCTGPAAALRLAPALLP
jgi:hypothetical protein